MGRTPGTIIVGVDGSAASMRAVHWAAEQAEAEHRQVTLVHAARGLHAGGREILAAAREQVARWAPKAEVFELVEAADPATLLLTLSADAAMVVVGSHGRGPVRTALLGSVGISLVRHAACPVVVLRPSNPGTVRNGVLVGVDGRPESRPVLEFAYREASLRHLPLTVLHAIGTSADGTIPALDVAPMTPEEREAENRAVAEAMAGMTEKYPDVTVTARMSDAHPAEALVRLGARMNLVVVGAHQGRIVERLLSGSVSTAVVEHASFPVAVVPL